MNDREPENEIPPTIGQDREDPGAVSHGIVGQVLDGRFLIEKDLSDSEGADKGGMGLVFLARDQKLLGKQVVVKVLQDESLRNPEIYRKFLHEKEALIRLDHPNIVRILDSGELSDQSPFIVMEYIQGSSLRKKLQAGGSLGLEYVAHIVESTTSALAAAHRQGIIHRDIKPENIMLTPADHGKDHVKLIDFGVARVEGAQLAPMTEVPRGIGTVIYMAPEQLAGTFDTDEKADIYSFAIVAYELLTSERPFKPQSSVEMYVLQQEGVKTAPRSVRPEVPAEAEELLLSALAFDPKERPSDIGAFGRELAGCLRRAQTVLEDRPTADIPAFQAAETKPPATVAESVETEVAVVPVSSESPRPTEAHSAPAVTAGDTTRSGKPWKLLLVVIAVLLTIAGPVAYAIWLYAGKSAPDKPVVAKRTPQNAPSVAERAPSPSVEPTAEMPDTREQVMTYSFEILKNGGSGQEPFKSAGGQALSNGDKFRLSLTPASDGFVWVLSDDADESGGQIFNILFPTPVANAGSPKVSGSVEVRSGWNTLEGGGGTETLWVIRTSEATPLFEQAQNEAFENRGRIASSDTVAKIRDFLRAHEDSAVRKAGPGTDNAVVSDSPEFALRIELEHW